MSIDSFGYEVMSLREVIETLQRIAEDDPILLDKAVWVKNCPPLWFPVKSIGHGTDGTALFVERGGN